MNNKCSDILQWDGKCCSTGERTTETCYDKKVCGCKITPHETHRFPFKDTGITTTDSYLHKEKE